jgi:hypothetical protein
VGVAGDFRRLAPCVCRFGSRETKSTGRKAGICGPFPRVSASLAKRGNGWLTREGSNSHIPIYEIPFEMFKETPLISGNLGLETFAATSCEISLCSCLCNRLISSVKLQKATVSGTPLPAEYPLETGVNRASCRHQNANERTCRAQ